jgi:hypothetical protein
MPLCVYAIVGRRFGERALTRGKRARLRLVRGGAVSAVVAECSGPELPSARAFRAHDATVRRIARLDPAVLPARFATVVDSERVLVKLLQRWSDELRDALALVDRHEQMTLRLFAARAKHAGRAGRAGQAGRGSLAFRAGETGALGPGTNYMQRRAREHAAHEAPELEPLREAFGPIVAAEKIARHDRGPLVLTAYHLIPRGAASVYRRLLRRHAAALSIRAVSSGPWPPYAFVPELHQ